MQKSYSIEEKKLLAQVGNKIRALRTESGFSQEKLAFESNLDRTYIGSVERGERNISIINIVKISTALDVKPHELLKSDQ